MCLNRLKNILVLAIALIPACVHAQNFALPPKIECGSLSQANDISATYPVNATGVLNGTLAILPLPLETVRSIIPPQYQVLTKAYRDLLPGLQEGYYPALIELMHDHDVRFGSIEISDFSKASIGFPFIDLLGDGFSSFRWTGRMLVSSSNKIAIDGIGMYGIEAIPANFTPSCNAYDTVDGHGQTTFGAQCHEADIGSPCISSRFSYVESHMSHHNPGLLSAKLTNPDTLIKFFVNATNQPIFGNGKVCDNQIRIFDTSATAGSPWHITPVQGSVAATSALLNGKAGQTEWDGLLGARAPSRFIENNALSCQSLQGYSAERVAQQLGREAGQPEGLSAPSRSVNASSMASSNTPINLSTNANATDQRILRKAVLEDNVGIASTMKYHFAISTGLLSMG